MTRTLILLLTFWLPLPAAAQEVTDTDPLRLVHPTTGEAGTWIPNWLKREHLRIEADLGTCVKKSTAQLKLNGKQEAELEHRRAALEEEKLASKKVEEALAATAVQLEESEDSNDTLRNWLFATTGATVAAVAVLIVEVLK